MVTIFLSILSGAVIALALVAQVSHFGRAFIAIAIPLLAVVVVAGISTIGRLMQLNGLTRASKPGFPPHVLD